ncbi:hypothetical protein [Chroococcus sp. FPU101]|uniref:hypothetical protein n=1 Tax=Chroococcus sp. FPU101 TaxID=1974212 RepID=UPI001A8F8FAE|nr:hypothetical protein [Chroococcus sp. FPU101]GFE71906.1 hypothetical protein CFPU101_45160 [Chroococcus sp. FPU101]
MRCLLYSHQLDHVCQLHPFGVDEDYCLDFRQNPNVDEEAKTSQEELWLRENYTWYGNKLIHNHPSRYTSEEQLQILDRHPFLTGTCPQCGYKFEPVRHLIHHGII